jgi:hypothetical protein
MMSSLCVKGKPWTSPLVPLPTSSPPKGIHTMSEKQRPVTQVAVGSVTAAIWRNETRDKPLYTTTFSLRYKADFSVS